MNKATIYARTDKGAHATAAGSHELAGDLREILNAIDGMSTVEALRNKLGFVSASGLDEALAALVADDLIHEAGVLPSPDSERKAQELRAKIKARREGAERSSVDVDTHEHESEEQARRETEEQARREADAQARKLAEQQAEERARRDAEERARQEAAAQAQRIAEEQARREAEEKVQREAEEEARREAERAEQETQARLRMEADEKAWREAEEKFRREEAEAAEEARTRAVAKAGKASSTKPRKWGLPVALGLLALIVIGLVAIHLVSYDGQIPQFEKAITAQFQQPVKIKAIHLSLVPRTQLRLEDVSIGAEGQVRVSRITAVGGVGNLFSEKKVFTSIELDSPLVTESGLGWMLFGKSPARDVAFGQVSASNARLESKNVSLPAFDAKLQFDGDGAWKTIVIESADKNLSLELAPKGEAVQIEFKARSFRIPFGSDLTLDDLVASGTANRAELAVAEFKGFAHGGILGGNARLKWGANWSLAGELNARQIDTARLLPGTMDGRLAGTAVYAMQAPDGAKLFAANRLEGNFVVARGTLFGVDLGRLLQGGGMSGDTRFTELAGSFVHERGATQLRQVRLSEGAISANGTAEVDADSNVRGRFAVELKMSAEQRRANLAAGGTLKKIEWRRP